MPEPPDVGLLTHYVLENPWPIGLLAGLSAIVVAWTAMRDGLMGRLKIAAVAAVVAIVVFGASAAVTTSGEQAKHTTRQFVDAVVAHDVLGAMGLFADRATLALGSPTNPGFDLEYIRAQVDRLGVQYQIASNRITSIRGFTESDGLATVHLSCSTEVQTGYAATPSQWVLRVERQNDGTWKILRITCISINFQKPGSGMPW